ncbi:MAG: diguanylate cyclase [Rhodospirillales bacterium]|nr:diguanylate cyclase [Rhodospirillales bacterium]
MPTRRSLSIETSGQPGVWRVFFVRTTLVIVLVMLGVFVGMFVNNFQLIELEQQTRARAHFQDITLMRRWSAGYGGVFVEKTEGVESNPYLEHPDIASAGGKIYTLKNPALMTREISELADKAAQHSFHITSLKPINPDNRADDFERKALESFETGEKERFWREKSGDRTFLRYMAPLYTEKECLQCHATQGYNEGDVRGGISVKFDVTNVARSIELNGYVIFTLFFIAVVLVIISFYVFVLKLSRSLSEAIEKIREMAVTDELTGLFNRRHFFERLKVEMNRAKRYGHPLSCVILDLDHFKRVNDTHGHPAGDSVLRSVAQVLQSNCRSADVLARYGGEEFVGILPETTIEGAASMAEKVRMAIESMAVAVADGQDVRITASFGVAGVTQSDGAEIDEDELTRLADQALYRAKTTGRNRVECAVAG